MRRVPWRLLLSVPLFIGSLLLVGTAQSRQPEAQRPEPQPPYAPIATLKDLMIALIDPSADVVWEAVSTTVDQTGTVERVPQNDEEWNEARGGAIRLIEGANMLMMPGRRVARPGEKSEAPGVELEPEEIEKLINANRGAFNLMARAFRDRSVEALQAIDEKNPEKLTDVGERLDVTCENCHVAFWYPNQKIPPPPSSLGTVGVPTTR
jgi:hypothetical protein